MTSCEVKHAGRNDIDYPEVLKSDADVAKNFKKGELGKLCSLDFHLKESRRIPGKTETAPDRAHPLDRLNSADRWKSSSPPRIRVHSCPSESAKEAWRI